MEAASPPEPFVLIRREGAVTRVVLNRPRAINALTREMVIAVREGLESAARDGSSAVLLEGAGERGFCGGGDVKAMIESLEAGLGFLREEYRTDYAVSASPVPVVAVMDGITMGGGIGLAGHAALRVVTERSRLAMPETRIGILPDVGSTRLFALAPGRSGELLAAASGEMTAGDALALGFADSFVPGERLAALRMRLIGGEDARSVVSALAEAPPTSAVLAASEWFTPVAEEALGTPEVTLADPVGAALRLVRALEASELEQSRSLAGELRELCPTAVVVSLAQLARIRLLETDLAGVFTEDYRLLGRMMRRSDFAEGVRARLIDRDGAPSWSPAALEEVDAAEVAVILDREPLPNETALPL